MNRMIVSTVVGTTDSPCNLEPFPEASESEIDWILNEISKFTVTKLKRNDILAVWAGIRPLIRASKVVETR